MLQELQPGEHLPAALAMAELCSEPELLSTPCSPTNHNSFAFKSQVSVSCKLSHNISLWSWSAPPGKCLSALLHLLWL